MASQRARSFDMLRTKTQLANLHLHSEYGKIKALNIFLGSLMKFLFIIEHSMPPRSTLYLMRGVPANALVPHRVHPPNLHQAIFQRLSNIHLKHIRNQGDKFRKSIALVFLQFQAVPMLALPTRKIINTASSVSLINKEIHIFVHKKAHTTGYALLGQLSTDGPAFKL